MNEEIEKIHVNIINIKKTTNFEVKMQNFAEIFAYLDHVVESEEELSAKGEEVIVSFFTLLQINLMHFFTKMELVEFLFDRLLKLYRNSSHLNLNNLINQVSKYIFVVDRSKIKFFPDTISFISTVFDDTFFILSTFDDVFSFGQIWSRILVEKSFLPIAEIIADLFIKHKDILFVEERFDSFSRFIKAIDPFISASIPCIFCKLLLFYEEIFNFYGRLAYDEFTQMNGINSILNFIIDNPSDEIIETFCNLDTLLPNIPIYHDAIKLFKKANSDKIKRVSLNVLNSALLKCDSSPVRMSQLIDLYKQLNECDHLSLTVFIDILCNLEEKYDFKFSENYFYQELLTFPVAFNNSKGVSKLLLQMKSADAELYINIFKKIISKQSEFNQIANKEPKFLFLIPRCFEQMDDFLMEEQSLVLNYLFNSDIKDKVFIEILEKLLTIQSLLEIILDKYNNSIKIGNIFAAIESLMQNQSINFFTISILERIPKEKLLEFVKIISNRRFNESNDKIFYEFMFKHDFLDLNQEEIKNLAFCPNLIFPSLLHKINNIEIHSFYDMMICSKAGIKLWAEKTGNHFSQFPFFNEITKHSANRDFAVWLLENPSRGIQCISDPFDVIELPEKTTKMLDVPIERKNLTIMFWLSIHKSGIQTILMFNHCMLLVNGTTLFINNDKVYELEVNHFYFISISLYDNLKIYINGEFCKERKPAPFNGHELYFGQELPNEINFTISKVALVEDELNLSQIKECYKKGFSFAYDGAKYFTPKSIKDNNSVFPIVSYPFSKFIHRIGGSKSIFKRILDKINDKQLVKDYVKLLVKYQETKYAEFSKIELENHLLALLMIDKDLIDDFPISPESALYFILYATKFKSESIDFLLTPINTANNLPVIFAVLTLFDDIPLDQFVNIIQTQDIPFIVASYFDFKNYFNGVSNEYTVKYENDFMSLMKTRLLNQMTPDFDFFDTLILFSPVDCIDILESYVNICFEMRKTEFSHFKKITYLCFMHAEDIRAWYIAFSVILKAKINEETLSKHIHAQSEDDEILLEQILQFDDLFLFITLLMYVYNGPNDEKYHLIFTYVTEYLLGDLIYSISLPKSFYLIELLLSYDAYQKDTKIFPFTSSNDPHKISLVARERNQPFDYEEQEKCFDVGSENVKQSEFKFDIFSQSAEEEFQYNFSTLYGYIYDKASQIGISEHSKMICLIVTLVEIICAAAASLFEGGNIKQFEKLIISVTYGLTHITNKRYNEIISYFYEMLFKKITDYSEFLMNITCGLVSQGWFKAPIPRIGGMCNMCTNHPMPQILTNTLITWLNISPNEKENMSIVLECIYKSKEKIFTNDFVMKPKFVLVVVSQIIKYREFAKEESIVEIYQYIKSMMQSNEKVKNNWKDDNLFNKVINYCDTLENDDEIQSLGDEYNEELLQMLAQYVENSLIELKQMRLNYILDSEPEKKFKDRMNYQENVFVTSKAMRACMKQAVIFNYNMQMREIEHLLTTNYDFHHNISSTKMLIPLYQSVFPPQRVENSVFGYNKRCINGEPPFYEHLEPTKPQLLPELFKYDENPMNLIFLSQNQNPFFNFSFYIPDSLTRQCFFKIYGICSVSMDIRFMQGFSMVDGVLLKGKEGFYFLEGFNKDFERIGQDNNQHKFESIVQYHLMTSQYVGECSLFCSHPVLFWPLDEIEACIPHYWIQVLCSIDVICSRGWRFILKCEKEDYNLLYSSFSRHVKNEDLLINQPQDKVTKMWINRELGNSEYLLYLNQKANRSLVDLSQYPVFPWIVSDYTDEQMPKRFRDLSKPIGQLSAEKAAYFEATKQKNKSSFYYLNNYLDYSNVLEYMSKLDPFTLFFISFHDGKWDNPGRTFNSFNDRYVMFAESVNNSNTEYIPIINYVPEFLTNESALLLPKFEQIIPIDNVELPNWAKNPLHYTKMTQKLYELDEIRNSLPKWIDLIFGSKSRGDKANDAKNTYPSTQYIELNEIDQLYKDEPKRNEILEKVITMYGQCCNQIFTRDHKAAKKPMKFTHIIKTVDFHIKDAVKFESKPSFLNVEFKKEGLVKLMKENKEIKRFEVNEEISLIDFLLKHFLIITASPSKILRIDISRGLISDYIETGFEIKCLKIDEEEGVIIACSSNVIGIWTVSGSLVFRERIPRSPITCLQVTRLKTFVDQRFFVTGHEIGTISFWAIDYKNSCLINLSTYMATQKPIISIHISENAAEVTLNNEITLY